jgi:UDP-glucose 4-epimerase
MRFLILGGAGFLGRNLSLFFLKKGYFVVIADLQVRHMASDIAFSRIDAFYAVDIGNSESILSIIDQHAISCVINLGSSLLPAGTFDDFSTEMQLKILPSFLMLAKLSEKNIKYVYFSSGGAIYGTKMQNSKETDSREPASLYGYSKLMFEEYILFASRVYGLNYLIFRPSNPYGSYQSPMRKQGFITVALNRLINNESIEIWGDGHTVRDYIWVQDFVLAVGAILLQNNWNEIFNVGSGVGYSLNEIVTILESVVKKKARILYKPARTTDVDRIVLDISKLQGRISFRPMPLRAGIELYSQLSGNHVS